MQWLPIAAAGEGKRAGRKLMNRLLTSSAILIALSTPTVAQQSDTSRRQAVEKILATYEADFNKHDAAGISGLYSKDGILLSPDGKTRTGQEEIEENYEDTFKSGVNNIQFTLNKVAPLATDSVIYLGQFHASGEGKNGPMTSDGHFSAVAVREGGTWKIHLATAFRGPPPKN
jgi:uncharacterized protein (TIGR02246 family)